MPCCRDSAKSLADGFPTNQQFGVSSWFLRSRPAFRFAGNSTTRLGFTLYRRSAVTATLQYVDARTGANTTRTFFHALPRSQNRVCIGVANYVRLAAADSRMALHITVTNLSKRKVLIRLTGERSLTPRPGSPPSFVGGRVTVLDRGGAALANPANSTIAFDNAERVLILAEDAEWGQLKAV